MLAGFCFTCNKDVPAKDVDKQQGPYGTVMLSAKCSLCQTALVQVEIMPWRKNGTSS